MSDDLIRPQNPLDRHGWWIVILLTLLLGLITGPRVFTHPLWGDEIRTWRDGIEKPLSLVLTWKHNADHAPLGHLMARGGAALFGAEHPWALRLGSWICGLACVPALWWMGRRLWSGTAGLLMALMFVVDPNIGYQMTQARMYAPVMLAAILALTAAGSILLRTDRPAWRVVLLGGAVGMGIWSHATIFAVVIALLLVGIGCVATRAHRRAGVALLIGLAIGCAIGAQGIIKLIGRHDAEKIEARDVTDGAAGQFKSAIVGLTDKTGIAALITLVAIGGCIVMWRDARARRPLVILLALVAVLALANLAVAVRYRPVGHPRYLTVLQPALWLAMAVLLVELWRVPKHGTTLGVGSLCVLTWLSIVGFKNQRDELKPDLQAVYFDQAVRQIRSEMRPGDRFASAPRVPFGWYARYYGLRVDESIDDALRPQSARLTRAATRAAELNRGTIWLLCMVPIQKAKDQTPLDDPATALKRIADTRGIEVGDRPEFKRTTRAQVAVFRIEGETVERRGWLRK